MRSILYRVIFINILLASKVFGSELPIDHKATKETICLYNNLMRLSKSNRFLFGHQDAYAYGVKWKSVAGKSDIKDITGDHPALCGWDLEGIETGSTINITGVPFDEIRKYTLQGYERGEVITFSWHMMNPLNGKSAWDAEDGTVSSILPNGKKHGAYKEWLDAAAAFILSLKGKNGEYIPVILRLFHELNGNWFWWGGKNCTSDEFKQLWRFTISYLRDEKNMHNVLYAFSTDFFRSGHEFMQKYPGDEWVDIVGFDIYQRKHVANNVFIKKLSHDLKMLNLISSKQNKIPALTEFGFNMLPGNKWWTKVFLKTVKKYKLAYAMAWRNSGPTEYYVPYTGEKSSENFKMFYKSAIALFSNDIEKMKVYQ